MIPIIAATACLVFLPLPAPGISLQEAQQAIQDEVDLLKTTAMTQQEVDRISTRFISNLIYSQDDIAGQAKMIGNLEVNGLSYRLMDELPKHFESVSVQDIQRVAQRLFCA